MKKAEIAREVARKTALSVNDINAVIDSFIDTVKQAVAAGEDVTIRGFATIKAATRAARTARNLSTGEAMDVPECKVVKLRPAMEFKRMVAES